MGVDSSFLKRENRLLDIGVKCSICETKIDIFVNSISSAGQVWPFCEKCESYVDVVPAN